MSATSIIKDLQPIDHARAEGKSKEILDIALKQVGFIPNMYANMANAPAMLSTYLHGYALFRSESGPDGHPNSPTFGHLKFPHPERGVTAG